MQASFFFLLSFFFSLSFLLKMQIIRKSPLLSPVCVPRSCPVPCKCPSDGMNTSGKTKLWGWGHRKGHGKFSFIQLQKWVLAPKRAVVVFWEGWELSPPQTGDTFAGRQCGCQRLPADLLYGHCRPQVINDRNAASCVCIHTNTHVQLLRLPHCQCCIEFSSASLLIPTKPICL